MEDPHHFFDFLTTKTQHDDGLIEALGDLLPEAPGEDDEEQDFANKVKIEPLLISVIYFMKFIPNTY